MEPLLLIARVLLAAVFGLAAAAKLADRAGARQTMLDFGLPHRFATLLGIAVPVSESIVAVALLIDRTARSAAAMALGLLCAFILVIVLNLLRGRRPDCHCFGRLGVSPIGWSTVARNLVLASIASCIVRDTLRFLVIGGAALLAASALSMLYLARRRRPGPRSIELASGVDQHGLPIGLPVGTPAPPFELPTLNLPGFASLEELRGAGRPIVLLFLNPRCKDCTSLLPHIHEWQREYAHRITFAIMSGGNEERNRAKFGGAGLPPVLLQPEDGLAKQYGTWVTPSAVLVRRDGRIGSRVCIGSGAVVRLVSKIVTAPAAVRVSSNASSTGSNQASF